MPWRADIGQGEEEDGEDSYEEGEEEGDGGRARKLRLGLCPGALALREDLMRDTGGANAKQCERSCVCGMPFPKLMLVRQAL